MGLFRLAHQSSHPTTASSRGACPCIGHGYIFHGWSLAGWGVLIISYLGSSVGRSKEVGLIGHAGHGWGMDGACEISDIRQILQTTYVGCYLQPLKMALLDDICRFLNLPRHAVKVAGVRVEPGDAEPHPLRVRPLGQANVDHSACRIWSVLRTRAMRGKMWVMLP